MDLSFGLSGPEQWAVLAGIVVVLTGLISLWIRFAYDLFETRENWTAKLEQLKHRNKVELEL